MVPPASAPIVRTQLHDELLKSLRSMIMRGELAPGSRMQERVLCERFGVSRTPLREAFKVLAASGLVELVPNRGAWVTPLRSSHVRNCFQVVAMLEAGAAELAASHLTDAQVRLLRQQHERMVLHLRLGERDHVFRLDLEMHRTLVEAAGNRVLSATHAELAMQVERARYWATMSDARQRQSTQEHEVILEAAATRDPRALADALRHHCAMTEAAVVQAMERLAAAEADAA